MESGSCLCGAVTFQGQRSNRGVGVCHCKMCRVQNSGPLMAVRFEGGVTLTEARGLKWFASSDIGKRGFCAECGSTLFWSAPDAADGDWDVSVGTLDDAADEKIFEHIFVEFQPAYYDFADDTPRKRSDEA